MIKLVENYLEKLKRIANASLDVTDAFGKETRTFEVCVLDILLERSRVLAQVGGFQLGTREFVRSGSHICGNELDFGMSTLAIDNFLLSSVYELLDEESGISDPIPVYPSNRTMIQGRSMRSFLTHAILTKQRSNESRLPTIQDFCEELPPGIVDQILHNNRKDDGFIHDLTSIIAEAGLEPLVHLKDSSIRDFCEKYERPNLLEMKIKYYPGREDMRAYYVDKWPLRSLVGSILQQVLFPQNERIYSKMRWSKTMPRIDKNRIEWTIITPPGQTTAMLFGDISSFSSSNVNSWVYILIMYLLVLTPELKHLDDPFPISIDGAVMECKLSHLLFLYLYAVVFAPAHYNTSQFFAMGGYLGLAANMSLTMLSFLLLLQRWKSIIAHQWKDIKVSFRVGGDDFIISLTGPKDRVYKLLAEIQNSISKYVGKIKDPNTCELSRQLDHQTVGCFCKKTVRAYNSLLENGAMKSVVVSDEVIPLMETFLSSHPTSGIDLKRKSYKELFNACNSVLKRVPNGPAIRTLLLSVYSRLFNINHVEITKKEPYGDFSKFQFVDGIYASRLAIEKAQKVADVYCDGKVYRSSIKSKLFYLLNRESLVQITIWSSLCLLSIAIITEQERGQLTPSFRRVDMPDPSLLHLTEEVAQATEQARRIMGTHWESEVDSFEVSYD